MSCNETTYPSYNFEAFSYNESISLPLEVDKDKIICKNCQYHQQKKLSIQQKESMSKKRKLCILKSHFIKFCETTSLRGISRIVKSSDQKLRWLWVFFVSFFFIACFTCVGLLVSQYRAYNVIHQPRTMYNESRPFPSLTVCNLRPLTSRGIKILMDNNMLTAREYILAIKDKLGKFKNKFSLVQRKLVTTSWNLNTYFLNLPPNIKPNNLGHSRHSLIISCAVVYREGIYTSSRSCDKGGKWISTESKIFHNCHTFTVDEKYTNITFNLEMVLYLDNVEDTECHDCQPLQISTQLTGAHLNLHSENTYPQIDVEGLNLLPGTLTEIRFTPREWSMMEPPHGKCSKTMNKTLSFDNAVFKYTESSCKQQLLQEELIKKCQCIDYNQVPSDLMWAKEQMQICKFIEFPVYKNISNFEFSWNILETFMKRTKCELETAIRLQYILDKCKSPCTYYTYDTSISSAKWPAKSYHTHFLNYVEEKMKINKIKKNKENKKKFDEEFSCLQELHSRLLPYREIDKLKKANKTIEANALLQSSSFIEQNLLSVLVTRPNFDITVVEEKAVVSLTSFLSQTGGLLSIWSGITFFCIVETFELFILICESIFVKQNDKSIDNSHT